MSNKTKQTETSVSVERSVKITVLGQELTEEAAVKLLDELAAGLGYSVQKGLVPNQDYWRKLYEEDVARDQIREKRKLWLDSHPMFPALCKHPGLICALARLRQGDDGMLTTGEPPEKWLEDYHSKSNGDG